MAHVPKKPRVEPPPPKHISILGKESIVVGCGLLAKAGEMIHAKCKAARYAVVTDENVAKLHLNTLLETLRKVTTTVSPPIVKILPPGESAKCRAMKDKIEDWMLSHGCGRDTTLVALGGGVIGDLTGYVAACFMRGIKVVQVPTTLLAMVDSSVGGKTGIDTPHGKNLIGAFHHPQLILMDLEVLKTLPLRQLCNGMAEVVKTALLWDEERFKQLEQHSDEILNYDSRWLQEIVEGSAGIKAEVVTKDEKEGGLRNILNVGHSVGHAVEAFLQPGMLHGEAVAIGTVKEAEISRRLGYLTQAELGRIVRCLQLYRLPTTLPTHLSIDGLMQKMAVDKKNKGGKKFISLLERIGKCVENKAVPVDDHTIRVALATDVAVTPLQLQHPTNVAIDCVPGSKSISNRALLIAALGKGTCRMKGLLHSDDTQVMLEALQAMKACTFTWEDNGSTLVITGNGGQLQPPPHEIYLGNAGTASRFLTSAATLVNHGSAVLTGNSRMKERPIAPLVDALKPAGVAIEYRGNEGCLPVCVPGGGFPGGDIRLSAEVSSQYVSSVLITAPYARAPVRLTLVGKEVVSESYISMTLKVMEDFGVKVAREGPNTFVVPRKAYTNPAAYNIESDASSATYLVALPALVDSLKVTVQGIGSGSIQGDAAFAKLLADMGCVDVVQGPETTTVTSKGTRPKPIEVDMGYLTDAFMTAAVVMAIGTGVSRITGIANQRVKECNRIAAMVTELGKLGVTARELPDGLEIHGKHPSELTPARIHCYNDHRIAMSFGILATRVPGIVITDRLCVEKTYPEFWDHLQKHFGVHIDAVDASRDSDETPEKSIVFIGMRGAGKSTVGRCSARSVRWEYLDMDQHFESVESTTIKHFVEQKGWEAFRKKECELLEKVLHDPKTAHRHVISCGGGVVESKQAQKLLQGWGRVVYIHKSLKDIQADFAHTSQRPAWTSSDEEVYARRLPLYRACSTYELHAVPDASGGWKGTSRAGARLVAFLAGGGAGGKHKEGTSAFLSLTFKDLTKETALIPELEGGVDAFELRVDLLADLSEENIIRQISALRSSSSLPIIFTVRTKAQGGAFTGSVEQMAALMRLGVRLGCEYIDVETTLPMEIKEEFIGRIAPAKVISSFHDTTGAIPIQDLAAKFVECSHEGRADVVKVVATASHVDDCAKLRTAFLDSGVRQPCIALAMGEKGKLSRALNTFMTPVTHPAMPSRAAPGQLSMQEVVQMRCLIGMLPSEGECFLFGCPISHSKSPIIHNTAFKKLGFPYTYHLCETTGVEMVREVVRRSSFRGGSVTIPLKEKVHEVCAEVTPAAREIGAINTLIPSDHGIVGDNTDWLGIRDAVRGALEDLPTPVGVCIGAGGSARAACYAMRDMGVKRLLIWNRTVGRAEALAVEFGGEAVTLAEVREVLLSHEALVVSNIPGDAQALVLENIFPPCSAPLPLVLLDMAYNPRFTPLLQKAAKRPNAVAIEGIRVLIEQGLYQFRLWTGLNPPRAAVEHAVYQALEQT